MSPSLPLSRPSRKTQTARTENGTVPAVTAPSVPLPSSAPTVDQVEAVLAAPLNPIVMEIYLAAMENHASISTLLVRMEASVRTGVEMSI